MAILVVNQVCGALMVFIALALSPILSPRGLFFGVRVKSGFRASARGRRLLRRFRWRLALLAALCTALSLLAQPRLWLWVAGISLQLLGSALAYHSARREVLPHAVRKPASAVRSMAIEATPERLPGGPIAQLLPFASLLASGVWIALEWGRLPERFPIHWSASGVPNSWVEKQPGAVYAPLALGLAMLAWLSFIAWLTLRFSRRGATAAERSAKRMTLNVLLSAQYVLAILFSLTSVAPLFGEAQQRSFMQSLILLSPLSMIGLVVALVASSRAAANAEVTDAEPGVSAAADGSPDVADTHWKWGGTIYHNPDDPALFVPKSFGLGYTFNFGHPATYWVLGVLLGVPLLGVLLLRVALR